MKATLLLPLASLGSAFVLPNEQINNLQHVEVSNNRVAPSDNILSHIPSSDDILNQLPSTEEVKSSVLSKVSHVENAIEHFVSDSRNAVEKTVESAVHLLSESYFDAQAWLDSAISHEVDMEEFDMFTSMPAEELFHKKPCHKGGKDHHGPPSLDGRRGAPPHRGMPPPPPHGSSEVDDHPPHHGDGDHHGPPPHHGDGGHHGPPPHHRPGFHKSNLTVYQLISKSNYTTKLAKLINEYPDLVEMLNGTAANYTVFAPTDKAFEKIPEHAPKPSKELLKAVLTYHISNEFYPAGRVLVTRTVPTLFNSPELNGPQRLSTNIGVRGLTVNFYSRIVAVDIFGSNGVIHGVDSILVPPPSVLKIVQLLPSEFSTLELGLHKTGLFDAINSTAHNGGTLFAPSNFAFQKLGPKINAFLFSSYGQKYLKAVLQYHVVANQTLYSDAFYAAESDSEESEHFHGKGGKGHGPPRGFFHVDLPTALEGKSLSIDVARYGRLIEIKINGFSRVVVSDGIAKDGVLHVVGDVLIPPKKLGEMADTVEGEMELEEFMERFEPYLEKEGAEEAAVWTDL